jgi:hypothetical protein
VRAVGSKEATAPDGARWRVSRVWVERRLPRWRKVSLEGAGEAAWMAPDSLDGSVGAWLAVVIGTIVIAVIIIPLLLFGIELILLGLLIAAAILGRALLGRPWLVRASRTDGSAADMAWRVVGWRRSGRVIEELASALAAGTAPRPLEPAERVLDRPSESALTAGP